MALSRASRRCWLLAHLALTWSMGVASQERFTPLFSAFLSRPDIRAPPLSVPIQDGSTARYIFMAPHNTEQMGPYIYDKLGNLVWSGYGMAGPAHFHNFKPCFYRDRDHLCVHQGQQYQGFSRGRNLIMDSSYRLIESVEFAGPFGDADLHEFTLLNGGKSAIQISYNPVPYDLSDFGFPSGQGWVMDCVFQELDLETQEIIFQWRTLDNIGPADSYVTPNSNEVAGTGLSNDSPWNYAHVNSIAKSEATGHYLISARHTSALYLIDHTNGQIIWQLSADGRSTYACQGFNFSYQHDARILSENNSSTVISILDNASDGNNRTSDQSSAKIIGLNHATRTATLVASIPAPLPGGLLSTSQGNVQVLRSGNILIGWGSQSYVSEHAPDGRAVLLQYAPIGTMNYRAYSFHWTGNPVTLPDLYAFAGSSVSPTVLAVSWNGATEVAGWRFYGGASRSKRLELLGEAERTGFETMFTVNAFYPTVFVEAIAANGTSLANSTIIDTFVPTGTGPCEDFIRCPVAKA